MALLIVGFCALVGFILGLTFALKREADAQYDAMFASYEAEKKRLYADFIAKVYDI